MDGRGHRFRLLCQLCAAGLLAWLGNVRAAAPELPAMIPPPAAVQPLPIGLDTVIRQVNEQNAQLARARARVEEACAESARAAREWLHDPCEHAARKVKAEANVWQSRIELCRLTYETLLEAGSTYIDLVAARHAEGEIAKLHQELGELSAKAAKLAKKAEPGIRVEVARLQAEVAAREQLIRRLQAQADAAAARLVYLMALDPGTQLVPADAQLVPIDLVDPQADTDELVAQALRQGPGIADMEALYALVNDAARRAENRRLLGCLPSGRERLRLADAQRTQVCFAYQDLRGKLTAGVQEARQAIRAGSEEIRLTRDQVGHASEARKLSRERLDNNIAGSSYSEVLLSLQALGLAHASHINALRDYDKAQLRLLLLLGAGQPCAGPVALPAPGERIGPPGASEPANP